MKAAARQKKPAALTRGERVCAFIETYLKVPEGMLIGQPMKLMPFQRKFILAVYDNPSQTKTAILSIARKNGKSGLIAGLLLAHIVGPEAVQNSQIISGAQSRDQAGLIFKLAVKMVQQSPILQKLCVVMPSQKQIIGLRKNVEYRAIAAETKTAHGLSPVLAILDEIGQVEGPTSPFVDAITSSQGAHTNPMVIAISTQAPTDADLLSTWIDRARSADDPRIVCHVYEAPADALLDDRKAWFAANPALGVFKSLKDMEDESAKAITLPSYEPTFRNLGLNQRVDTYAPFVSKNIWLMNGRQPTPIEGRKVWAGLDLSSVHDLTALIAVADDGGVHCTFWLPEHDLAQKSGRDKVPWDHWSKKGLLLTTPGRAIEYEHVATYLRGFFDRCDVQALGFDRYNMKHLRPWLIKAGFSEEEVDSKFIEFGQGTASMTPALRELEVKLLNGALSHGENPILSMCRHNAVVIGDSGARKFDKAKARGRIDGMVALAMAVGVMPDVPDAPPKFQMFFVG